VYIPCANANGDLRARFCVAPCISFVQGFPGRVRETVPAEPGPDHQSGPALQERSGMTVFNAGPAGYVMKPGRDAFPCRFTSHTGSPVHHTRRRPRPPGVLQGTQAGSGMKGRIKEILGELYEVSGRVGPPGTKYQSRKQYTCIHRLRTTCFTSR
jgi:hypothetical protein